MGTRSLSRFGLFALCIGAALGQNLVSARAGLLNYVEGTVYGDNQRLQPGIQLRDGQTLRTEKGRAELLVGFGVILWLGDDGALVMENTKLTDARLAFEQGSALIEVTDRSKNQRVRFEFRDTTVEFAQPGLFRWDAEPPRLRVYGGAATISNRNRTVRAKRGQTVALISSLIVSKFDVNSKDALHMWAGQRSFSLVNVPEVIWTQKHWQATTRGGLWNGSFGLEFPSEAVARKAEQSNKDYLRGVDAVNRAQEEARQRQDQQRQAQQRQDQQQQQQPQRQQGK